jgi:hypothetical protein
VASDAIAASISGSRLVRGGTPPIGHETPAHGLGAPPLAPILAALPPTVADADAAWQSSPLMVPQSTTLPLMVPPGTR